MALDNVDSWELIWADEFDSDTIDTSNWTYDVGGNGWGNNELEYYTDRADNSYIEDGCLVIVAKQESYIGKSYTSARLKTQGLRSFTYGKIEAKIKATNANGKWVAFWTLGENQVNDYWSRCGEIDIMERTNSNVWNNMGCHWYTHTTESHASSCQELGNTDGSEWHVYGIEWDATQIRLYIDDTHYRTVTITDAMNECFNSPQYLLLNMAVGGNYPGNKVDVSKLPFKMYIDYVRVFGKKISFDAKISVRNNWYTDTDGNKYFTDSNGKPLKHLKYINGDTYFFDDNGIMKKGLIKYKDRLYYFDSDGKLKTNWVYINGDWYYFSSGPFSIIKDGTDPSKIIYYEYGQAVYSKTIYNLKLDDEGKWILS